MESLPTDLKEAIGNWRSNEGYEKTEAWREIAELQAKYSIPTEELPEDVVEYNFKKDLKFQDEEKGTLILPAFSTLQDQGEHYNELFENKEYRPSLLEDEIESNDAWKEKERAPYGAERARKLGTGDVYWYAVSGAKSIISGGFCTLNKDGPVYEWADKMNGAWGEDLKTVIEEEIGKKENIGEAIGWDDVQLAKNIQSYAKVLYFGTVGTQAYESKEAYSDDLKKLTRMSLDLIGEKIREKINKGKPEDLDKVLYMGHPSDLVGITNSLSHIQRKLKATEDRYHPGYIHPENAKDMWSEIKGIEETMEKIDVPKWLEGAYKIVKRTLTSGILDVPEGKEDLPKEEPKTMLPFPEETENA